MFGGNLGVALGAAADEFNNQRRMAREAARDKREEEQFGWAREEQARKKRISDEADAIMKEFNDLDTYYRGAEKIGDDQLGEYIKTGISRYNENPLYKNGMFANVSMVDGKPMIVHGNMAKLGGVQMMPVDRDTLRQGYESMRGMLMERLARTSPEAYQQHFYKERDFNLKGREVGAKETEVRQKGEYQQGILDWHDKQAGRPQFMQDGTGRVMAISPDGKLLGTYGSARPDHTGAQMTLTNQLLETNKALNLKYAPLFEQAEKDVAAAYATNDPVKIRAAQAQAQLLNSSYQREMATKNPTAGGLRLNLPPEPNSKASTPIEVEVPSADGKGTVKVKTTMDEAVANGWVNAPIPVAKRPDPRGKAAAGGIPAYAEDAPTLTLADQLAANTSPTENVGVAPGGFYANRPKDTGQGRGLPRPSAFTPGTDLTLQDLMVPRNPR